MRYGIDADVAVRLVRDGVVLPRASTLVGPNVLRSHALSIVYQAHRRGELSRDEARAIVDGLTSLRIRLLGDRVSRGLAWDLAEQFGWEDIGVAEYIAVAKLQADVFVTLDRALAKQVKGIVETSPFSVLSRS